MINQSHISYLDAIRGLAALTVITEHFTIAYGLPCEAEVCKALLDRAPFNIWWDGGAAVSMFFVLSGLVLSLKYFRLSHKPDLSHFNLTAYVIGRMFRIWIPYCVVLLISSVLYQQAVAMSPLTTALPASDWIIGLWHNHPLSIMAMFKEGFLLQLPETVVLLPQAWTLTIELVLSLLLPIGLLLIEKGTHWLVFFAMLAVSLLGVSGFVLHFCLGLLIARYHQVISDYLKHNTWQRCLVLLIGLGFYSSGGYFTGSNINEKLIWFSSGLGASLILLFVLSSIRAQAFLSHSILRQIGKISYSAYLIHMAVLICLTPFCLKVLEQIITNRTLLWFTGWLLTIATVHGLSLIFYRYLETPCMAIGKYVIKACSVN